MCSSRFHYRPLIVIGMLVLALALLGPVPSRAQSSNPRVIESDDPRVFQNGTWSSQTTPAASNGSYLFSGGTDGDILGLSFVGSAIEIIYVAGPQFGTLAIEIDRTVLRTVITTSEKIEYGQVAKVDYLSDEPHSLKIYAQAGGIVAVDAFRITPVIPIVGDGPVPSQAMPTSDDGGIQSSPCAPLNVIHRVSLTNTGGQSNNGSFLPTLSADGRYVAFSSIASLVPGDGDSIEDIYVYDRQTCAMQLVSVSSTRAKGNDTSSSAQISADGRFIVFTSAATNLVPNDTNGSIDIFVYARLAGNTFRVSVASGGIQSIGGSAQSPSISGDGRFVTFYTSASDLVAGDTNSLSDIFVHDRQLTVTTRVSVATGGAQATGGLSFSSDITPDGRYVAFSSAATNLVAGDTNGVLDVFVHDRQTTTTTRVSVATGGTQANGTGLISFPAISADGRYIAFESDATNLVTGDTNGVIDIFVHDRQTTTTTRVSIATGGTQATGAAGPLPSISADGRYIVFYSTAPNLVTGDTNGVLDAFLHDRQTGTTSRVSVAAGGLQGAGVGGASFPAISADGRYIAFGASFTNLVPGDTNGQADIFVTPRVQPATDTLALFQPVYHHVSLLNTLTDSPPYSAYTAFSAYAPVTNGQWVMGDWNGDGLKTPGVYDNGPFYFTNKSGESQPSDWFAAWIGVPGVPVSGRFNGALPNDCIGVAQQSNLGGSTVFVLFYACNLTGTTTPAISSQWLSAVLPDSGGFSGTYQFAAGDFNSDGLDSIAVRRGTFIAFGNVAPITGPATFDLAQFIGTPQAGSDAGIFVIGDWDGSGADSFSLFYQNGELFYRNDLTFNSGVYINQSVGTPFGNSGVQATSWR